MSIIYDALKKVEGRFQEAGDISHEPKIEKKRTFKLKVYLIYAIVVVLGFLSANLFNRFIISGFISSVKSEALKDTEQAAVAEVAPPVSLPSQSQTTPAAVQGAQEISSPGKDKASVLQEAPLALALTGVFFSGKEGYALINNQILREGDTVDGAVVTRVSVEEVDLKYRDSEIRLPTHSKY